MKYNRTPHAPISLSSTNDDKFCNQGIITHLAQNHELILTIKLDGQNNCINKHGVFARSHAQPSQNKWDLPLIEKWKLIKDDLDDYELFGENMFGVHSIKYDNLESYFYLFAVRCKDKWLSWDEVKFFANYYNFPTVQEIKQHYSLKHYIDLYNDESRALEEWLSNNLGLDWKQWLKLFNHEGFVVRIKDEFIANSDQFDKVFKIVRPNHVVSDEHWSKNWIKARLIDYNKYDWQSYSYLR